MYSRVTMWWASDTDVSEASMLDIDAASNSGGGCDEGCAGLRSVWVIQMRENMEVKEEWERNVGGRNRARQCYTGMVKYIIQPHFSLPVPCAKTIIQAPTV